MSGGSAADRCAKSGVGGVRWRHALEERMPIDIVTADDFDP